MGRERFQKGDTANGLGPLFAAGISIPSGILILAPFRKGSLTSPDAAFSCTMINEKRSHSQAPDENLV